PICRHPACSRRHYTCLQKRPTVRFHSHQSLAVVSNLHHDSAIQAIFLFSSMTCFAVCFETCFTLRAQAEASARSVKGDAVEDDGRTRTTNKICGGGAAERAVVEQSVP